MATEIGKILINMRMNAAAFQRDAQKVTRSFGRMSRESQALQKTMAGLRRGALAVGAAGGAFALLAKRSLDTADSIAKQADAVGIGVERYQELVFAADKAQISQGQLNSNLTAFIKRVGEARQGTGPLVSFLQKYDKQLLANIQNSRNQDEALRLVAESMGRASEATDKAALANAAFGRSGVAMTRMLGDGGEQMEQWSRRAREMGIIIDEDLARQAEKANDQLSIMSTVIRNRVVASVVELAPQIVKLGEAFAEALPKVTAFLERFSSKERVSEIDMVKNQLKAINAEVERLTAQGAQQNYTLIRGLIGRREDLQQQLEFLRAIEEEQRNIAANSTTGGGASPVTERVSEDMERAKEQVEKDMAELRHILSDMSIRGAGRDDGSIDLFEAMVKQFEDLERKARETYGVLGEGSGEASEQMKRNIKSAADEAKVAVESMAFAIGTAFEDAVIEGKALGDIIQGLARDVQRIILRRTVTSRVESFVGGVLDNLNLFNNDRGGLYKVGGSGNEHPVAFNAKRGEIVAVGKPGGGGGAGNIRVEIVNRGAPKEVQSAQPRIDVEGTVVRVVLNDINRGGPIRRALGNV